MLGPQDIQKANIDSPPEPPVPSVAGDIVSSFVEGDELAKQKIVQILGNDSTNPKKDFQSQAILDYVKSKGAKTMDDVLWEVRMIANRLGTPGYGESNLSFVYEYIYLLNESKNLNDKLKRMEVFNA